MSDNHSPGCVPEKIEDIAILLDGVFTTVAIMLNNSRYNAFSGMFFGIGGLMMVVAILCMIIKRVRKKYSNFKGN